MKKILHKRNEYIVKDALIMRQAFAIASLLIGTGVLLTYTVDIRFLLLPLLVAGGLLFTSIFGWCPMAYMLERMPWNESE